MVRAMRVVDSGLLKRSVLSLGVRGLGAVSAFIMNVVVARLLGAEESGLFFLAFSIVFFSSGVVRCGLDNAILKLSGVNEGEALKFLVVALMVVLGTSLFAAGGMWLFAVDLAVHVFGKAGLADVIEAMSGAVIGLALLNVCGMFLQGQGKIVSSVFFVNISSNFVFIVFVFVFNISDGSSAAAFFSLSCLISILVSVGYIVFRERGSFRWAERGDVWAALLGLAFPLWVFFVMSQAVQWMGQFVSGAYVAPDDVAKLAAAQRTAMLISFILVAINLVVAPKFAKLYANNDVDGVKVVLKKTMAIVVVFAFPPVIFVVVFSDFVMAFFGDQFASAGLLLKILAVGQFFNVVTGPVGYLLIMSGFERDMRNIVLVVFVMSLFLHFSLTPLYGVVGSALSTSISVSLQNVLAFYFVRKRLGMRLFSSVL